MGKQIAITGAGGFIGKNITAYLECIEDFNILPINHEMSFGDTSEILKKCDVLIHLAGVNRPKNNEEFYSGNVEYTKRIINVLKQVNKDVLFIYASSIQAELDNPYGQSKLIAEEELKKSGLNILIYRFNNIFGKWSRPDYNSVVATFCHNVARDIPIHVDEPTKVLTLNYIDDVCIELLNAINSKPTLDPKGYGLVKPVHMVRLGELAGMIEDFKSAREKMQIPLMINGSLQKKLYSTFLSFVPIEDMPVPMIMHEDKRGCVTELVKTPERGQIIVNKINPGIVKGNHYHHSKNEKFIVISGEGLIKLREHGQDKIYEIKVSGDKLTSVDIPPGYTHSIENTGDEIMYVLMWCNEQFNPEQPDTYMERI